MTECKMTVVVEGPDERGWRKRRCARHGCTLKTDWTPDSPDNIHFGPCKGLPLASELADWVRLFSDAFGLTRAAAIVRYIHWKFKGSPLDELPPGVSSPNVLTAPTHGPGTALETIFRDAGAPSGCNVCKEWRDKMNQWGPEGCREHRAEIIQRLQQAAYETWITDSMRMGFALMREPWFRWDEPLGSCVDEAIRRAELDPARPAPR